MTPARPTMRVGAVARDARERRGDQSHWAQGDCRDDCESTDAIEDDPAVIEAARKRQRENWGKPGEAAQDAAEQIARMKGHPTPLGISSNVRRIAIGRMPGATSSRSYAPGLTATRQSIAAQSDVQTAGESCCEPGGGR